MRLVRILFIGDVSGSAGRRAVSKLLRALRSRLGIHFTIVNGENAAGGLGITHPTAANLFDAGADVITLGNHAFAKRDVVAYFKEEMRILRPANFPPGVPGRGWGVFKASTGDKIVVANLLGRTFMTPVDCPFRAADTMLEELNGDAKIILVDMHGEATSEKVALGWYLDGRVSAVIGTHTHIQTADERILPKGTAYLTDAGMTGVQDSVLGLDVESVIERFLTQVPPKFLLAEGTAVLNGVVMDVDPETGHAVSIRRIILDESGEGLETISF